jgi:hypothetical protein
MNQFSRAEDLSATDQAGDHRGHQNVDNVLQELCSNEQTLALAPFESSFSDPATDTFADGAGI